MSIETKVIVTRIGETDQLYLTENTPELALERADLRMQLAMLSRVRQEQIHFLQEAIVLLEQARIEYDEMPMNLYLNLSLHLAKAYMIYFELNKEKRFALITQQILKPLSHHEHADIYFSWLMLRQHKKNRPSLGIGLLNVSTTQCDLELVHEHPVFHPVRHESWYKDLLKLKTH